MPKAARPACRATPPARLSAATMLSAIFSRPAPRDAVTVSGGMKKKVAGADSSGERLPLLPGPTPPRTEASAVGLHAGPSPRRHTPTQPGRSPSPPARCPTVPLLCHSLPPQESSAPPWRPSCGCSAQQAAVAARGRGGIVRFLSRLRALSSSGLTLAGPTLALAALSITQRFDSQ